jgi:hypothetical protein
MKYEPDLIHWILIILNLSCGWLYVYFNNIQFAIISFLLAIIFSYRQKIVIIIKKYNYIHEYNKIE